MGLMAQTISPGKAPSALPPGVTPAAPPVASLPPATPAEIKKDGLGGSVRVRPDARTMTLAIPAPRGLITDRHGEPFAQSKVVWYPALKFVQFERQIVHL